MSLRAYESGYDMGRNDYADGLWSSDVQNLASLAGYRDDDSRDTFCAGYRAGQLDGWDDGD